MRFIYTKAFAIFSTCLVVLAIITFLQVKGYGGPIQAVFVNAPRPVAAVVSGLARPVENFFSAIYNLKKIGAENAQLSAQVALLDAQQYQASVHAFERVAALRPDYADAYTNMAIVEIAWEKYDDAKGNLAKALALLAGDPRALYYRALVERNAGQISSAITDLEAMLSKYPRSKDGLRELGFSYYQQHEYTRARDTYVRLQAVDPDDLAAHYQLAILYRRLGDKQKAAIESAKFADQKDDPTAGIFALAFLRKHPEVAGESVVWHTHDLTGDPKQPLKIEYKYIPGAGI